MQEKRTAQHRQYGKHLHLYHLLVSGGLAKVDVTPSEGTVVFEAGDVIYVGSGGKYVGFLTHDGNHQFMGNITNPVEGESLQFYFLGNVTPEEILGAGSTEECSVIISNQTEHLPVISCAPSDQTFSFTNETYTAHLLNKCALVKFFVTTPVTVDFLNNTLTTSVDGEGVIMLPAGAGENVEHWAILLPQDALDAGEEGSVYVGSYTGIRPAIPAIHENAYWAEGIALSADAPAGAAKGLFTINAAGTRVFFSQGNLQYIGSAAEPFWQFAEHPWDCIGSPQGSSSTADRDFFGWGTSGYNHGASLYQPWATSTQNNYYYAYGSSSYNLYDQTGQADWGYNAIVNGGNQENSGWRTPTSEEWAYIYNTRSASMVNGVANARFAKAKVADVQGMILFPDDYTHPSELAQPIGINNTGNTGWNSNNYTEADFALMEANGAVFLPAAGFRNGTSLQVGYHGCYWSSSCNGSNKAYLAYFNSGSLNPQDSDYRYYGYCVRLVRNAYVQ